MNAYSFCDKLLGYPSWLISEKYYLIFFKYGFGDAKSLNRAVCTTFLFYIFVRNWRKLVKTLRNFIRCDFSKDDSNCWVALFPKGGWYVIILNFTDGLHKRAVYWYTLGVFHIILSIFQRTCFHNDKLYPGLTVLWLAHTVKLSVTLDVLALRLS